MVYKVFVFLTQHKDLALLQTTTVATWSKKAKETFGTLLLTGRNNEREHRMSPGSLLPALPRHMRSQKERTEISEKTRQRPENLCCG